MQNAVRQLALLVFLLAAVVALLQVVFSADGQPVDLRKNKYGIDLPGKYTRIEDAIAAAEPYAVGGHRGTMFHLADGRRRFSTIKYTEAVALLGRESCACFLNTGKGVANTLYVPDPCDQYVRLNERCRRQQKPLLRVSTENGMLKIGIHCTKLEELLVNCPVR